MVSAEGTLKPNVAVEFHVSGKLKAGISGESCVKVAPPNVSPFDPLVLFALRAWDVIMASVQARVEGNGNGTR
jgi:hypothetical protein